MPLIQYIMANDSTCAISSDVLIIRALLFRFVTTESTAMVIPRLRSIAFMPAATDLQPSANMARVRTVAQVVPGKGRRHHYKVNMKTTYGKVNFRHEATIH